MSVNRLWSASFFSLFIFVWSLFRPNHFSHLRLSTSRGQEKHFSTDEHFDTSFWELGSWELCPKFPSELFSTRRILWQSWAWDSGSACPIFSNETHYYFHFVFSLCLAGYIFSRVSFFPSLSLSHTHVIVRRSLVIFLFRPIGLYQSTN